MRHVVRTALLVVLLAGITLLIAGLRGGTTGLWVAGLGPCILAVVGLGRLLRRRVIGEDGAP